MARDDLVITPEEVRAVARFPHRDPLLVAALAALALAAFALADRGPPIPPAAPPFDPAICGADPLPASCLAHLPPELRRIPTAAQYIRWRRADLVGWFARAGWPDAEQAVTLLQHGSDDALRRVTLDADVRIGAALQIFDPWERIAGIGESPDPGALIRLGAERDWSAETRPPLSADALAAAGRDLILQRAEPALRLAAQNLEDQRRTQLEAAWSQAVEDEARAKAADEAAAHRRDVATALAALLGAVGALLLAAWATLAPRTVVVGLHHLRVGQRTIPWSDVTGVDWDNRPIRIRAGTRVRSLGPRILGPSAQSALAVGTERALDRAASLGPADPDALRALGGLRSAGARQERS